MNGLNDLRLISPDDGSLLKEIDGALQDAAGNRYTKKGGVWNLTPQKPVKVNLSYQMIDHSYFRTFPYQRALTPLFPANLEKKFSGVDVKMGNVLGFIPEPDGTDYCLDHGCGSGKMRAIVEPLGYTYVGVDNESGTDTEQGGGDSFHGGATHYCDLHKLPFEDNVFRFSISYSVFEHMQNPFVAAAELYRVMKPGGIGFMAVADLIPFHMDSFYHHTHFGVLNLFKSVGFEVLQVAGANWNGYRAISEMDGLPGPRFIRKSIDSVVYATHKYLWKLRARRKGRDLEKEEIRRHNMMAGIMKAVVRKPL